MNERNTCYCLHAEYVFVTLACFWGIRSPPSEGARWGHTLTWAYDWCEELESEEEKEEEEKTKPKSTRLSPKIVDKAPEC